MGGNTINTSAPLVTAFAIWMAACVDYSVMITIISSGLSTAIFQ
jgi:hypothetical protein